MINIYVLRPLSKFNVLIAVIILRNVNVKNKESKVELIVKYSSHEKC
jgi:hypothetical protein